jgi:carboxypeptidase C (cathepsin A)
MRAFFTFLTIISLVTAADYCTVNDHAVNITTLPYAASDIHPCQYAGTINTAWEKDVEHNLFYWFFRNENASAPLIIWINGGPGSTSMFGLFLENGPMRIVQNGTTMDDFEIRKAEEAWTDDYHVLYLDQPANVGFSWGTSYVNTEQEASYEFSRFLIFFFEKYPEFHDKAFYLTGESYAGKYLPLYTHDIIEYNKYRSAAEFQNISGTFIGDPYTSPVL